jgi:hypothetical protein
MNKKNLFFVFLWIFFLFIFSTNEFKLKAKSLSNYRAERGIQIFGKVQNSEGVGLPGITVSLTNPVLMGKRTTVTSETGNFRFVNLTPGKYEFEIEGFSIIQQIPQNYGPSEMGAITCTVSESGGVPKEYKTILTVKKNETKPTPPFPKPSEPLRILKATISEDSGLNKINKEIAQKDKSALYSFYYSGGKIFAQKGVAKVDFSESEKKLNRITKIPHKDEKYVNNGLELKGKCVYSIRLGEKDEGKLIIRVLEKSLNKIEIEYYIEVKDE